MNDMCDNLDVVMAAVCQNGLALQWASERLASDQQVVDAAAKQNFHALQFATHFQNNKTFVLQLVEKHGTALRYAHKDLQDDLDVVMVAVTNDGLALQYASVKCRAFCKAVTRAMEQNVDAFAYADISIKQRFDMCYLACQLDVEKAVKHLHPSMAQAFMIKSLIDKHTLKKGPGLLN
jgi:hypothetical protein